jgi:hypothetical protein
MFENKVLKRIFGGNKEEAIGRCKKLHNEELHNFCSSSPQEEKPVGRQRARWKDSIKADFRQVRCERYGLVQLMYCYKIVSLDIKGIYQSKLLHMSVFRPNIYLN